MSMHEKRTMTGRWYRRAAVAGSLTDAEIEDLLAGEISQDHRLTPLESLVGELRAGYGFEAAPTPSPTLAARLEEGRVGTPEHAPRVLPRLKWATRGARPRVHVPVRLALATVLATLTATGGLATAGALPAPLQNTLARTGASLGIDLPRATPTHRYAPRVTTTTTTVHRTTTATGGVAPAGGGNRPTTAPGGPPPTASQNPAPSGTPPTPPSLNLPTVPPPPPTPSLPTVPNLSHLRVPGTGLGAR